MLFFQVTYKNEVKKYLVDKEHISEGLGTDQFLYFIMILTAVFFLLSIGMTIYMLIRRKRQNSKKKVDNGLIEKYQDFLSGFLILPVDDAFLGIQKENRLECRLDSKDISDPYRRKLLAKEIYELKKDLCGQQEIQLTNYFFGLGLQNEVAKMLGNKNWADKVKAMQMIKSFKILEYLPEIRGYVNDENRELAIHAILVTMEIEQSFNVLFNINQKLNDWESHKILNAIKKTNVNNDAMNKLLENVKNKKSLLHRLSFGLIEKEPAVMILQDSFNNN